MATKLRVRRASTLTTVAPDRTAKIVLTTDAGVRATTFGDLEDVAVAAAEVAAVPVAEAVATEIATQTATPIVAQAVNAAATVDAAITGNTVIVTAASDLPAEGVNLRLYSVTAEGRNYRWYDSRPGLGTPGYVDEGPTLPAVQRQVARDRGVTDLLASDVQQQRSVVVQRLDTVTFAISSGFGGIAASLVVGTDIAADAIFDEVVLGINPDAGSTYAKLRILRRLATAPDLTVDPEAAADITVLGATTYTMASLGILPNDVVMQRAAMTLPAPVVLSEFNVGDVLMILLEVFDASNVRKVFGFSAGVPVGTLPVQQRGWYVPDPTIANWGPLGPTRMIAVTLLRRTPSLASRLLRSDTRINAVATALASDDLSVVARTQTGAYALSGGFAGVAFGITTDDVAAGTRFDGINMPLAVGVSTATIRVRLMHRPAAITASLDPENVSDVLLEDRATTPAAQDLTPGGAFGTLTIRWDGSWVTPSSGFFLVLVEALDEDGEPTAIAWGQAGNSGWSSQRKGWYRPSTISRNWGVLGSQAVVWSFVQERFAEGGGVALDTDTLRAPDVIAQPVVTVDGFDVDVALTLIRDGVAQSLELSTTLTAPDTGTVTGEAVTLDTSTTLGFGDVNSAGRLDNAAISNLVVTRTSDSAVLVSGTAYDANLEHGAIRSLSGEGVACTVAYTHSETSYDLLYLDAGTLALGVVAGEGRIRDAVELPAARTSPAQLPVAYIRRNHLGLRAVPIYTGPDANAARLERNRHAVRRTRARLRRGQAVTWGAQGDSITQLGQPLEATYLTPNGINRDRAVDYGYLLATGSDLADALPLYDFGDGAGQVHTKIGWNWETITALQAEYDSAITYLNFGIGGTTSAATTSGGRPNGTDPARLAAFAECGAHVGIIGFGMNERGSSTTAANLVTLGEACIAEGMELVFIGCPKPSTYFDATDNWIATTRQIARAADYLGAAFIDTVPIYAQMGIDGIDCCAAALLNHPGPRELTAIGRALTPVFAL